MGSKRSSMPHRFHALVHGVRLIVFDRTSACRLVNSMGTLISGLGVERLLPRFPPIPVDKIFAWATPADDNAAAGPADALDQLFKFKADDSDDALDDASTACPVDDSSVIDDHADQDDHDSACSSGSESSDDGADFDADDFDDRTASQSSTGAPTVDVQRLLHLQGPPSCSPWMCGGLWQRHGCVVRFCHSNISYLQDAEPPIPARQIV